MCPTRPQFPQCVSWEQTFSTSMGALQVKALVLWEAAYGAGDSRAGVSLELLRNRSHSNQIEWPPRCEEPGGTEFSA